jgi:DNA-binding MarR family transcriptional regulator
MSDTMDLVAESGVLGFEEKHMIAIMMFLSINGECQKIEIYRNVSSNPRIPDKLDRLEVMGLIKQISTVGTRAITIALTPKGKEVAEKLIELDGIVKK